MFHLYHFYLIQSIPILIIFFLIYQCWEIAATFAKFML